MDMPNGYDVRHQSQYLEHPTFRNFRWEAAILLALERDSSSLESSFPDLGVSEMPNPNCAMSFSQKLSSGPYA